MPLKKFWSRIFNSNDIEFQVLKSTSAVELHYLNKNARFTRSTSCPAVRHQRFMPRYYSQYDDLTRAQVRRPDPESELRIVSKSDRNMNDAFQEDEISIAFIHVEAPKFPTPLSHIPEHLVGENKSEQAGFDALLKDPALDSALATCHLFRQHPDFEEGILLKCLEPKSMFPYLHYGVFRSRSESKGLKPRHLSRLNRSASPSSGHRHTQGVYEELHSIIKKTASYETRLPATKNTGYIVIGYKILQPDTLDSLEKSWLSWSGAREITKYTPRAWSLKRITLHKSRTPPVGQAGANSNLKHQLDGFTYVLLCEFGNIMHPEHALEGCDVVEKLKARNCGHVGFYRVHWTYSKSAGTKKPSLNNQASFDTDSRVPNTISGKPEHKLTKSLSCDYSM